MHKKSGNERFSFHKRLKSFGYAFRGIRSFFLSTHNAWIHAAAALLVIAASLFFQITIIEWIAVIFCIGLVFTAEAFNTAVEQYVDLVQPEFDSRAGNIKDIAAGAVLISAICAAIIGLLIFLPRIFN